MREGSRLRTWLIIAAATVLGIVLIIGTLYWGFRRPVVHAALSHRVDRYLKDRLGLSASIGNIEFGWNSIQLTNLVVPIDSAGSQLIVASTDIDIALSDLFRSPREPVRIIKAVHARGVNLVLNASNPVPKSTQGSESITSFRMPPAVYTTIRALDSLNSIRIDDAAIEYSTRDSVLNVVQNLALSIDRQGENLHIAGNGTCLGDSRLSLTLSGDVQRDNKSGELSVFADVPSGVLPYLNQSSLTTSGARIALRISLDDSVATLSLTAACDNLHIQSPEGAFDAERVRVSSSGDTLRLDTMRVDSKFGTAVVHGDVLLSGRSLNLSGRAVLNSDLWQHPDSLAVPHSTPVSLDFRVCGTLAEPTITADTPEITIGGQVFRNVACEAGLSPSELIVHNLSLRHSLGRAELHGRLSLDSLLSWSGSGQILLDSSLTAGTTWKTKVSACEFDASGRGKTTTIQFTLLSHDSQPLARGHLSRESESWMMDLTGTNGEMSNASFSPSGSEVHVAANNAQVVLHSLFDDPNHVFSPIESLNLKFDGTAQTGTLSLESSLVADSVDILPQVLHTVSFDGSYQQQPDHAFALQGNWSGVNGDGQSFEGSADLDWHAQRIDINHLFIDQSSGATGYVDLSANQLDVEFNVLNLPFDKVPLRPKFMRRAQVAGNTTGRIHVSGNFAEPEWTVRLSVVDGAVLNVPGYWINLDADGRGLVVNLHQFELGRDIRRILVAQGTADVPRDQVSLTVETGSGLAEDFVMALSGRKGIVTGSLEGRATISGHLTRPDVDAQVEIKNGELFNQFTFTSLNFAGQVNVRDDGTPVISLPRFELRQDTTYEFTANAQAVATAGGPLQMHLEGHGDFLNILDQMDREFAAYGSQGELRVDVGGTVDHPQFTGGSFVLNDGRFSFPSATPSTIDANLEFHVNSAGVVESGRIGLRDGDQELDLVVRSDWKTTYPDFKPLIIPSPRIDLGVLEIHTGARGMPVRIPGLMKAEWLGQVISGPETNGPITISAQNDSSLHIAGNVDLHNSRITFPFAGGGGSGGKLKPVVRWLIDRLTEAKWDLNVLIGQGNHYDVEITGLKNSEMFGSLRQSPIFSKVADYIDHLNVDAVIDPAEAPLAIRGTIADKTFFLDGRISSSRGHVEYFDQRFNINSAVCEFDETNIMPVLEGRASTTGIDATGRQLPVYLTMYVIDRETKIRQRRGRLDDLTFVLEDDAGDPPEDVLALLGYDVGSVSNKAQELVATSVVRAIGRQWIDPIERRIEKWTPLDEVTLDPASGRTTNLARQQQQKASIDPIQSRQNAVRFFTGSQLTVGKYFTNDVFFTYTGELAQPQSSIETGRLSLVHLWNLEYRIQPVSRDLVLDLAVEYDEFERKRDESVSIKYSFALEP